MIINILCLFIILCLIVFFCAIGPACIRIEAAIKYGALATFLVVLALSVLAVCSPF